MIRSTNAAYGFIAKTFHWLIAVLFILLLAVGLFMTSLTDKVFKIFLYDFHKALGMVVLGLVLLRIIWRLFETKTQLPVELPNWQKKTSNVVFYALYFFMVIMPITGYLMSVLNGHPIDMFGYFTLPDLGKGPSPLGTATHFIHVNLPYYVIAILSLHVLAALYHHFIRKDNVMNRMLFWR